MRNSSPIPRFEDFTLPLGIWLSQFSLKIYIVDGGRKLIFARSVSMCKSTKWGFLNFMGSNIKFSKVENSQ